MTGLPWRTIETAPQEYGALVLLWIPHGDPAGAGYFAIGTWGRDSAIDGEQCWVHSEKHYWLGEPSHWIALEPPK